MGIVHRPGLERRLKAQIDGEVHFDSFSRGRYATDASSYQMMPMGVVIPRTGEAAVAALAIAREEGVAVTARGGGTSQAGQTVNETLVIDCSRNLTKLVSLDKTAQTCVVEPGIVLDELNRQLKPHGLWFPVDVSTASRATIGGMVGNNSCGGRSLRYGTTRDNVIGLDAVLADGNAMHFGAVRADLSDVNDLSRRALFSDLLALGALVGLVVLGGSSIGLVASPSSRKPNFAYGSTTKVFGYTYCCFFFPNSLPIYRWVRATACFVCAARPSTSTLRQLAPRCRRSRKFAVCTLIRRRARAFLCSVESETFRPSRFVTRCGVSCGQVMSWPGWASNTSA